MVTMQFSLKFKECNWWNKKFKKKRQNNFSSSKSPAKRSMALTTEYSKLKSSTGTLSLQVIQGDLVCIKLMASLEILKFQNRFSFNLLRPVKKTLKNMLIQILELTISKKWEIISVFSYLFKLSQSSTKFINPTLKIGVSKTLMIS